MTDLFEDIGAKVYGYQQRQDKYPDYVFLSLDVIDKLYEQATHIANGTERSHSTIFGVEIVEVQSKTDFIAVGG